MKKFISLFAVILLLVPCFCIIGCSNSDKLKSIEYDEIRLTSSNYSDYIAINVELSDYNLIVLDTPHLSGQYNYTASVVVHLNTASKNVNYQFKNVSISYAETVSTIWSINNGILFPTATLDYCGNSRCSYVATAENKQIGALSPIIFTSTKDIISAIEGYVLIPKSA